MAANSLEERLARESRLPPREAVRIGVALARSVDQLHRQGHKSNSIVPSGITLNGDRVLLVADAGSSRTQEEIVSVEEPLNLYPSPEELAGQKADARTDVYRLGALIYQMLIGSPPPRPLPMSRLPASPRLRRLDTTPSVHATRRDVSRALDAAISRAMAHDARDRFATPMHFADVLEESLLQRLDHQPHSDRPSQMAIVDSFEFGEEEVRGLRREVRGMKQRRALVALLVLAGVLVVLLLRKGLL
ncbi:MAG: hypothetical protein ABI679_10355 [Gemmatimonadota bacterium]